MAILGDQHLLFQLHALAAADLRQVLGTTLRDPIGGGIEAAWAKAKTDMTRG